MKIARPDKEHIEMAMKQSHKGTYVVKFMMDVCIVLLENCTDPQSDTIELSPYLFTQHVANEQ